MPLELRTVGEAISLEGKVMGRSDEIYRWSWRDGVLTAASFEDVDESITMRMELDFEWPAGTTATNAGLAPVVELMT